MAKLGEQLFKTFGISEWDDKASVLNVDEKEEILTSLKEGIDTDLTELVKLPYPEFIRKYLVRHLNSLKERQHGSAELDSFLTEEALSDPQMGYKLYLASPHYMKDIMAYINNPQMTVSRIFRPNQAAEGLQALIEWLSMSLSDMIKSYSNGDYTDEKVRRFVHIMSYIDKEEAERLQLDDVFTFCKFGEYRGFDMDKKLASLNPLVRHIFIELLGLNGAYYPRMEIEKEIGVVNITPLVSKDNLLALAKSCEEFRSYIKYVDKDYQEGERIEYAQRFFITPKGKTEFCAVAERIENLFIKNHVNRTTGSNITTRDVQNMGDNKRHEYILSANQERDYTI